MSPKSKKSNPWPLLMVVLGGLLVLGAGGWYAVALLAPTPTPEPAVVEETTDDLARVSVADAKAAYDLGQAVFMDVRDAESYAQAHIRGAISMPLEEIPQRMDELDPQAWIITY
ncbi:MAG: hypothetical protein L0Z70_03630 [Chloroflexi bacterium]|nr:hypothetical protein [Chloroflexota bacterium]